MQSFIQSTITCRVLYKVLQHAEFYTKYYNMQSFIQSTIICRVLYKVLQHAEFYTQYYNMQSFINSTITCRVFTKLPNKTLILLDTFIHDYLSS